MVVTQREIEYLPTKDSLIYQSKAFLEMQAALAACIAKGESEPEDERCRPSLLSPIEQGCPETEKIPYEPGDPIENICGTGK